MECNRTSSAASPLPMSATPARSLRSTLPTAGSPRNGACPACTMRARPTAGSIPSRWSSFFRRTLPELDADAPGRCRRAHRARRGHGAARRRRRAGPADHGLHLGAAARHRRRLPRADAVLRRVALRAPADVDHARAPDVLAEPGASCGVRASDADHPLHPVCGLSPLRPCCDRGDLDVVPDAARRHGGAAASRRCSRRRDGHRASRQWCLHGRQSGP